MENKNKGLIADAKPLKGRYGGFPFGGMQPAGVTVHEPLPIGTIFPNGAKAAFLLTFDVEGTYGNGTGDMQEELRNYEVICMRLSENSIPATFHVVGRMAEDHGPLFVRWMLDSGSEVASHGYVHDLNKQYGGDRVYAGHYGFEKNLKQVNDGVTALNKIDPNCVRGFRVPYAHFNEFTYDAIEKTGLVWSSNVGIDDFVVPGQGFGTQPFQMQLGERVYSLVEIPFDSQTYDWSVWVADESEDKTFVDAVRKYCTLRGIPFVRTPEGAYKVWNARIQETIKNESVFTLLCHPINLTVKSDKWNNPVEEFLFPVIDLLGKLQKEGSAWVCTCGQMANFYNKKKGGILDK